MRKMIPLLLICLVVAAASCFGSKSLPKHLSASSSSGVMAGSLPDAIQITNQPGGWQIFPGQGYRYGPSIIAYPDGSVDMWFAASCYDGKHWDQIRYRHSPDGGRTWEKPDDVVVVTPNDGSADRFSCCDPGAIRFGGYYYVGYTAVDNEPGQRNHVFLARAKSARGPYEKWNGKGWGGDPEPFLKYTGDAKQWGCGEPSFVLKDGKLYVYYTWNDGRLFTDLAVCNDPKADDWPAHMVLKGHVIRHSPYAEDSLDVKYVDSLARFVAVATNNRVFTVNANVSVWQSADGVSWTRAPFRGVRVQTGAHNMGISGNEFGHIDGKTKPFISYSYGWPGKDWTGQDFGWANWATYIDPIKIDATGFGQPVHIEVSSAADWTASSPRAIDGDPRTAWSSKKQDKADAEEWAAVWLGQAYPVDGLMVKCVGGSPVKLTLQYSNDGKSWVEVGSCDSAGPSAMFFGRTITASWFRVLAKTLPKDEYGSYSLQIHEIETLLHGQVKNEVWEDGQLAEPELFTHRSIESITAELGPVPRPEHPRPDAVREHWSNLNGVWEFAFDAEDKGEREAWQNGRKLDRKIIVPFCPESQLSGIYNEEFHKLCWYARSFDLPKDLQGKRVLLHFGAVDYRTKVWLNGHPLGQHVGGYDPFSFDVTDIAKSTGNRLVVRVHDDPQEAKPKGKQSNERYTSACRYMRTTGIWQTVWLEVVGQTYIHNWTIVGDPSGKLSIKAIASGEGVSPSTDQSLSLLATASHAGAEVARVKAEFSDGATEMALTIPDPKPWSPDSPTLYDLDLRLVHPDGRVIDCVRTYFGLRSVSIKDGMVYLNGKPFFVVSALDQGFYPQGLYTPPTDEALRQDVEWAKRYGLNNVRKHQIVAEPRFHYWCDKLGLTIWGEMADWGAPLDDEFLRQWSACVKRDINHPCVITWVPTNERRCGDDNAARVRIHEATKKLDPTLPVIDTSGYCHTVTDICDLHVNPIDGKDCVRWWKDWRKSIAETGNFPAYPDRPTYCEGYRHRGQPVMFSETGNWYISALPPLNDMWKAYGYGPCATLEDYIALYKDFFLALMAEPECAGFSYVQLYDVEGEVNGYLSYDRKPKVSPEVISAIHAEGMKLRERTARQ